MKNFVAKQKCSRGACHAREDRGGRARRRVEEDHALHSGGSEASPDGKAGGAPR